MANISKIDRIKRLIDIKSMLDEGKGVSEISESTGLPIQTVNRNIQYIDELAMSELSPEELAKRRQEIYLDVTEAIGEIRTLFDLYKNPIICPKCEGKCITEYISKDEKVEKQLCDACKGLGYLHKPGIANNFFLSWMGAIEKKAKLYGLDSVKSDNVFNLNQQFNYNKVPDKIDANVADRLSKMIKDNHDKRVRDKYESEKV